MRDQTTHNVVIKLDNNVDGSALSLRRESFMSRKCIHTNVVPLLETMVDNDRGPHAVTGLVFPYFPHGTVSQLCIGPKGGLKLQGSKSDKLCKFLKFFASAVSGLQHMHNQGVVHTYLHPGCLFRKDEGQLMIGGLQHGSLGALCAPQVNERAYFKAPEVLDAGATGKAYEAQKSQDIWSLAVIFFVLLCGKPLGWAPENTPAMQSCLAPFFTQWRCLSSAFRNVHFLAACTSGGFFDGSNPEHRAVLEVLQEYLHSDPQQRPAANVLLCKVMDLLLQATNAAIHELDAPVDDAASVSNGHDDVGHDLVRPTRSILHVYPSLLPQNHQTISTILFGSHQLPPDSVVRRYLLRALKYLFRPSSSASLSHTKKLYWLYCAGC